ncbi:MAG TPA: hypothetical protein VJL84_09930 [Kiloniellales bacterium]|nr:hypothetical protein [Kiloniellales bacterium]
MYYVLQIVTLATAAMAMALPLAHLLEWPGKLRLNREQYVAMQRVYYPGFTYAGALEPLNILLALALVLYTPVATPASWLRMAALILIAAMHASYWLVTHPINRVWLADAKLSSAGTRFFGTGGERPEQSPWESDWRPLRRRWEMSHALRAGFGFAALLLLAAAAAL